MISPQVGVDGSASSLPAADAADCTGQEVAVAEEAVQAAGAVAGQHSGGETRHVTPGYEAEILCSFFKIENALNYVAIFQVKVLHTGAQEY